MRLIRADQYRRMPWKNGGGETVEVAVSPEGARLADFDWRVSMARVASDGPFSAFPGIDRTLTILEGRGLRLQVGPAVPVELEGGSPPLSFPADVATEAWLLGGPVLDLNVMTRRGLLRHEVERLAVVDRADVAIASRTALVLCQSGSIHVDTGQGRVALGSLDSLRVDEPSATHWALAAETPSTLLLIRLLS